MSTVHEPLINQRSLSFTMLPIIQGPCHVPENKKSVDSNSDSSLIIGVSETLDSNDSLLSVRCEVAHEVKFQGKFPIPQRSVCSVYAS
jgi:hypothetical protein